MKKNFRNPHLPKWLVFQEIQSVLLKQDNFIQLQNWHYYYALHLIKNLNNCFIFKKYPLGEWNEQDKCPLLSNRQRAFCTVLYIDLNSLPQ